MTTKNFAQMTTKKLNALMATASDEDKAAIQEVLAAREQAMAQVDDDNDELTPEEQAALEEAEKNGGINPMYNGSKSTAEKKPKMTNEELHELAESLRPNIGHRCQVVPFNTIEWADGYIAGVMEEKRSGKVLYAIKLEDGRRIVKVYDSNLLRILDETIEVVRAPRTRNTERTEWTPEAIAEGLAAATDNVGRPVTMGEITGRIVSVLAEKRAQRIFYRIEIPAPTAENPDATKITHKVYGSEAVVLGEFDEVGTELNAKYKERKENATTRKTVTPQERVMLCEENLAKAQAKLAKAQAELEAKQSQLAQAKAELEAYLANQTEDELA